MDYQDIHAEESEVIQPVNPETTTKQPPNNMATASLVLGIIALVTFCCYYTVLPLGGLSILFGLLSRPEGKFSTSAKAGMIMSVIALVLTVIFWVVLFVWLDANLADQAVRNMPVIPSIPDVVPGTDNVLTFYWQAAGGVR